MPIRQRVVGADAVEAVSAALGDRARDIRENFGSVDLVCDPDQLVSVMSTLRDVVDCRFFSFLSAVDRTEMEADKTVYPIGLEVLILVYSPDHGTQVAVHVPVAAEKPTCPTISGLFGGAIWHERECFEMFGIEFEGHPHLVNLYLPEDFDGHPGLRSFKLPTRTAVKPWPGAKDPEEAAAGGR
jgi:NADH-quinone oxidoreductase subunit C